jgi:hypothetical protein
MLIEAKRGCSVYSSNPNEPGRKKYICVLLLYLSNF